MAKKSFKNKKKKNEQIIVIAQRLPREKVNAPVLLYKDIKIRQIKNLSKLFCMCSNAHKLLTIINVTTNVIQ